MWTDRMIEMEYEELIHTELEHMDTGFDWERWAWRRVKQDRAMRDMSLELRSAGDF